MNKLINYFLIGAISPILMRPSDKTTQNLI